MDTLRGAFFGASGRGPSLRREWARAFTIMLVLIFVAGITTIVGVHGAVGEVRTAARLLHREQAAVAAVNDEVVAHEQTGHKLLSDEPVDRVAYLRQQQDLSDRFAVAEAAFPQGSRLQATVVKARETWQSGLMTYGLWGPQVALIHGDHSAENPLYGAASDDVGGLLSGLEGPSLDAMEQGLARGDRFERLMIAILSGLFAAAFAVTLYFGRRMVMDLLHPVARMHAGVERLRAGDYESRIEVARRDELGELGDAFNSMANALREIHHELSQRATHDSLTGLPNRASLSQRLSMLFAPSSERRAVKDSVLFIDVDDFKEVNDSLGHEGGDALLVQLAIRLQECVRPHDLVARLGGDEFAVVVVDEDGGAAAGQVAQRILDALRVPFIVGETSLAVSVSIGAATRSQQISDPAELLRSADFAMYMAKGSGKNRYHTYDAQVRDAMAGPPARSLGAPT